MAETIKKYFTGSILFTVIAIVLGGVYGYITGGVSLMLTSIFVLAVLGVMETSLSFDNAVVNANVLEEMDDTWRHRFLTWGMVIAVFGVRIVFPIAIVAFLGHINPLEALHLALVKPEEYEKVLTSGHVMLVGFGATFLMIVGLGYFFDSEKERHWIPFIEKFMSNAGNVKSAEVIVALLVVIGVAFGLVPADDRFVFLCSAVVGLVSHEIIAGISDAMQSYEAKQVANGLVKGGIMAFLYLELIDFSCSIDGVIGSFVVTNNFILIALGLSIGAMFVRSLTILMVEKKTMAEFVYLEHGAFWGILTLTAIMFTSIAVEVPEIITGILSVAFIGCGLISSIRYNKNEKAVNNG